MRHSRALQSRMLLIIDRCILSEGKQNARFSGTYINGEGEEIKTRGSWGVVEE